MKTLEFSDSAESKSTIPASPEYERTVLSSMMLEKSAIETCINMLDNSCFYKPAYQILFHAIIELYEENIEIDQLSLEETLKKKKLLDQIGGPGVIAALSSEVCSSANIKNNCKTLINYSKRRSILLLARTMQREALNLKVDFNNIIETFSGSLLSLSEQKQTKYYTLKEAVPEAYQELLERREHFGECIGIPSDFQRVDKMLDGFRNSTVTILAGRPSKGKSSLATDIARNIAKQDIPVAFFSIEMSVKELAIRLIGNEARIEIAAMHYKKIDNPEEERLYWTSLANSCSRLQGYPLLIDATPAISITQLASRLNDMVRKHHIQIAIIDYLQLMRGQAQDRKEGRRHEVESVSRDLKRISKQFDIPIIALSQLHRNIENRPPESRPQLSDLRESGAIEQDADVVMFIHNATQKQKEDYSFTKPGQNLENIRELIVRKNRNGPTGMTYLYWHPEYMRFENLDYRGGVT